MKSNGTNMNVNDIPAELSKLLRKFSAYKVFLFFLAVAGVYGFIVWRINVFSNAPPNASEQAAKTVPQPRIDPATIQKIESLKSNNVRVQALFNKARQSPFQE